MVNNIDMCSCLFPPIHSIICLFFPVVSQRHLSARTPHLSSKSVTCIPAWPVQIWSTDLTRSNGLCCLPLAILFVSNMCCTIVQFPAWHSAHCASSPLVWAIPPRLPARLHQTPAGFVFPMAWNSKENKTCCIWYGSGWWLSHPSEKYEFVSWDYYSQLNGKNKKCFKPPTSYCRGTIHIVLILEWYPQLNSQSGFLIQGWHD